MTKRVAPPLGLSSTTARKRPKLSSGAAEAEGEVVLVDGVYLNDESITQISRLFKIIDRNSDGSLDIHDFTLNGVISDSHFQKWAELRDKFDFDGDGLITMEEFWRGFVKMVLKLGCRVTSMPEDSTIEGYLRAIEDHVNDQVQELCKSAYLWYSDNQ